MSPTKLNCGGVYLCSWCRAPAVAAFYQANRLSAREESAFSLPRFCVELKAARGFDCITNDLFRAVLEKEVPAADGEGSIVWQGQSCSEDGQYAELAAKTVVDCGGGGDCLYRATAHVVCGDSESFQDVRDATAAVVRARSAGEGDPLLVVAYNRLMESTTCPALDLPEDAAVDNEQLARVIQTAKVWATDVMYSWIALAYPDHPLRVWEEKDGGYLAGPYYNQGGRKPAVDLLHSAKCHYQYLSPVAHNDSNKRQKKQ
jgi:hypothetical protein